MTREEIIRMARKAGFAGTASEFYMKALERFAALVAAAEREACAKVCDSLFDADDDSCNEAEKCAESIRARGTK